jgi:hypothetical protein
VAIVPPAPRVATVPRVPRVVDAAGSGTASMNERPGSNAGPFCVRCARGVVAAPEG